ncbi:MBL fold metallo-hydrolase [Lysinibacillus sp. fls2-241-R2A-57]|uniref:MBL fold metallo-hydrolase n=1 Tax=Lysinibacillus sp. fls2-241-R2A-57 TaxID=3040292 RepID=UPI002554D9CD|nr:MBL fold metallo-hydrolase [Lysinibacillus sp. fls2-241-R2A-57]
MKITAILENSKLEKKLTAKHGLSLYIETEQMNIIFDLGPDHSYIKNAQALGIDLNKANAVIISHGHSDHIGGLSYLDEVNKHAPIYLSSNALESHWLKIGPYYHNVGAKDTLKNFDNRLKFIYDDIELTKGIHIIHLAPTNEYTNNLYKGAKKELDDFNHEIVLVIENENELVLFSGCSHHGIVNITKTITEKFPNKNINATIGGFHLIGLPIVNTLGKSREEVISIGNTLNEMKIDCMYSCHCTGTKGFNILKTVLKEKLQSFKTGQIIEL